MVTSVLPIAVLVVGLSLTPAPHYNQWQQQHDNSTKIAENGYCNYVATLALSTQAFSGTGGDGASRSPTFFRGDGATALIRNILSGGVGLSSC